MLAFAHDAKLNSIVTRSPLPRLFNATTELPDHDACIAETTDFRIG
jgi:hypothetical protein